MQVPLRLLFEIVLLLPVLTSSHRTVEIVLDSGEDSPGSKFPFHDHGEPHRHKQSNPPILEAQVDIIDDYEGKPKDVQSFEEPSEYNPPLYREPPPKSDLSKLQHHVESYNNEPIYETQEKDRENKYVDGYHPETQDNGISYHKAHNYNGPINHEISGAKEQNYETPNSAYGNTREVFEKFPNSYDVPDGYGKHLDTYSSNERFQNVPETLGSYEKTENYHNNPSLTHHGETHSYDKNPALNYNHVSSQNSEISYNTRPSSNYEAPSTLNAAHTHGEALDKIQEYQFSEEFEKETLMGSRTSARIPSNNYWKPISPQSHQSFPEEFRPKDENKFSSEEGKKKAAFRSSIHQTVVKSAYDPKPIMPEKTADHNFRAPKPNFQSRRPKPESSPSHEDYVLSNYEESLPGSSQYEKRPVSSYVPGELPESGDRQHGQLHSNYGSHVRPTQQYSSERYKPSRPELDTTPEFDNPPPEFHQRPRPQYDQPTRPQYDQLTRPQYDQSTRPQYITKSEYNPLIIHQPHHQARPHRPEYDQPTETKYGQISRPEFQQPSGPNYNQQPDYHSNRPEFTVRPDYDQGQRIEYQPIRQEHQQQTKLEYERRPAYEQIPLKNNFDQGIIYSQLPEPNYDIRAVYDQSPPRTAHPQQNLVRGIKPDYVEYSPGGTRKDYLSDPRPGYVPVQRPYHIPQTTRDPFPPRGPSNNGVLHHQHTRLPAEFPPFRQPNQPQRYMRPSEWLKPKPNKKLDYRVIYLPFNIMKNLLKGNVKVINLNKK